MQCFVHGPLPGLLIYCVLRGLPARLRACSNHEIQMEREQSSSSIASSDSTMTLWATKVTRLALDEPDEPFSDSDEGGARNPEQTAPEQGPTNNTGSSEPGRLTPALLRPSRAAERRRTPGSKVWLLPLEPGVIEELQAEARERSYAYLAMPANPKRVYRLSRVYSL
ncbi:unnamed protein product [Durusdinium trenchii]|uniref:Uncharacterized protein n=1 Tax=Durusdinium trenchii TaxID=1381693 RepID=A0ABP0IZ68_9DINO